MAFPDSESSPATEPGGTGCTMSSWPFVIVIEDCYVPEFAPDIVKLAESTTSEQQYAVILALAVYAETGLRRERLN